MGESKQQPRALLGEQWAAHSPTRAPDFITGLSIPPAWELWDLGQAAAADRSTLTHHTQPTCRRRPSHHCIPPLTAPCTANLSIHTLSMGGRVEIESKRFPTTAATILHRSTLTGSLAGRGVWLGECGDVNTPAQCLIVLTLCLLLLISNEPFMLFLGSHIDGVQKQWCRLAMATSPKLFPSTRTFFVCEFLLRALRFWSCSWLQPSPGCHADWQLVFQDE